MLKSKKWSDLFVEGIGEARAREERKDVSRDYSPDRGVCWDVVGTTTNEARPGFGSKTGSGRLIGHSKVE